MRRNIITVLLILASFSISAQEVLTLQESRTSTTFKHPKENGIYIQPAVYLDFTHWSPFGCDLGLHGDASLRALWQCNDRFTFGLGVNFCFIYSYSRNGEYGFNHNVIAQVNGPLYIMGRYYYTNTNIWRPYVDLSIGFLRNYALMNGYRRHFISSDYNDIWEREGLSRFYAGVSLGVSYNKFDMSLTFDGVPFKYNEYNAQTNSHETHKGLLGRIMFGVAYNFRIIKTR